MISDMCEGPFRVVLCSKVVHVFNSFCVVVLKYSFGNYYFKRNLVSKINLTTFTEKWKYSIGGLDFCEVRKEIYIFLK